MTRENRLDDGIENQLKLLEHFIKDLHELDRALVLLYLEEKSQKEIAGNPGIIDLKCIHPRRANKREVKTTIRFT